MLDFDAQNWCRNADPIATDPIQIIVPSLMQLYPTVGVAEDQPPWLLLTSSISVK